MDSFADEFNRVRNAMTKEEDAAFTHLTDQRFALRQKIERLTARYEEISKEADAIYLTAHERVLAQRKEEANQFAKRLIDDFLKENE